MFRHKTAISRLACMILVGITAFAPIEKALAQGQTSGKYTRDTVDANKRSVIEVDPVTLALNISITLGVYPGRGGELPITLNYNSKLWRVQYSQCDATLNYEASDLYYAEHSAAGWVSSLRVPFPEYFGDGEPFVVWFHEGTLYAGGGPDYGQPYGLCGRPEINTCSGEPGPGCTAYPWQYYASRIRLHMPGGSSHELRQSDEASPYGSASVYKAIDGSGILYYPSQQKVHLPDGSYYLLNTATGTDYIDRNGNKLSYNRNTQIWTDTLGRTFSDPLDAASQWASPGQGNYTFVWHPLRDSATGQTVLTNPGDTLKYSASYYYNGQVNFLSSNVLFGAVYPSWNHYLFQPTNQLFNPVVLHKIILPNGQEYKFTYNIYGEIDKVVLPSGGYKRYSYSYIPPTSNDVNISFYTQTNRGVVDMWESEKGDGSDERHWHFDATTVAGETKITAPDGTYTKRSIRQSGAAGLSHFGFALYGDEATIGRVELERAYDAAGNLRHSKSYNWVYDQGPTPNQFPTPGQSIGIQQASRNPRLASETETYNAGTTDKTRSVSYPLYDGDQNVIVAKSFAYADGASSGSLIRSEEFTYYVNASAPAEYRQNNLIRLPKKVLVKDHTTDPAGIVVSATEYNYDEYALTTYPSVTSWVAPANSKRGNVTTIRRWLNRDSNGNPQQWVDWQSGNWIVTHNWYDQCGNMVKSSDGNGKETIYNYQDNFDTTPPPGTNTYAYLKSVTTPIPDPTGNYGSTTAFTTTTKYDFYTGSVKSVTDANGVTATYEYETGKLNRPTKVISAAGTVSQTQTVYKYNDALQPSSPPNPSEPPRSVTTISDKDASGESTNGNGIRSLQVYDGLGRTYRRATY
jgi:hypothetical protein